jgi:protoheme IX farnesyltransferase
MMQAVGVIDPPAVAAKASLLDYVALTKPRITGLVAATAAGGWYLGAPAVDAALLLHAVGGTALCSAGASALNMAMERELDAKMARTANRPIAAGRVSAVEGWVLGTILSVAGAVWLALAANWIAAALGLAAILGYAFIYTPSKTRTSLSTLIGAVPGALPPVIGYAAGRGALDRGAVALFLILFFWQLPHFLALAWMYRQEYANAGCPVLTVTEPDGASTARQMILQTCALIVASLLPLWFGVVTGAGYLVAATVLGVVFLGAGVGFARTRSRERAVRVFLASVIYLPVLFGALALARASIL